MGWFAYVSQLGAFAVWNGVVGGQQSSGRKRTVRINGAGGQASSQEAALALYKPSTGRLLNLARKKLKHATTPEDVSFEGEYSALHYAAKAAAAKIVNRPNQVRAPERQSKQ